MEKNLKGHRLVKEAIDNLKTLNLDDPAMRYTYLCGKILAGAVEGKNPHLVKSQVEYDLAMRDNCR